MTQKHDVILVGFDLRIATGSSRSDWTRERRESFLLDPATPDPLSVDSMVWPRLMTSGGDGPLGLWLDLVDFEAASDLPYESGTRIALGIAFEAADADAQIYLSTSVAPCHPIKPAVDWRFLGYDVADNALLSGLSNCGYMPEIEEVAALRAIWASRLNKHGLFHEWSDATEFRMLSNHRVPEHAPFYVFGLWIVSSRIADRSLLGSARSAV